MKPLPLKCQSLDDLLGGGIESSIITKLYGEAGTGKTNICLQAARECILSGNKAAYIDTESVSLERLKQISTEQSYKTILDQILFFTPTSFDQQEKIITEACERSDIKLIVVDTINMLYRAQVEADKEYAMRSFLRQTTTLQLAARKHHLYVLVVEQVYTDKAGEIKPFTHRETDHMVKTVLKLERKGIGHRKAILMKHRFQPEGKTADFQITAKGLE